MDRGRLSTYAGDSRALDQVLNGAAGARRFTTFNRDEALERVGDDLDLLKEIAQMFLDECDTMVSAVEVAVAASDAAAVERSAHALKGCVSNFGAEQSFNAAFELEKLGRAKQLATAPAACNRLKAAIDALCPELEALIES